MEAPSFQITLGIRIARTAPVEHRPRRLQFAQAGHYAIAGFIRDRDAEAARAAMRKHIDGSRMRLLEDSVQP